MTVMIPSSYLTPPKGKGDLNQEFTKCSIRRAAKDANIHEKTLRRYIIKDLANPGETIKVLSPKIGTKLNIPREEEQKLALMIKKQAARGFGLHTDELQQVVQAWVSHHKKNVASKLGQYLNNYCKFKVTKPDFKSDLLLLFYYFYYFLFHFSLILDSLLLASSYHTIQVFSLYIGTFMN